jgi:hypothetical protein
MRFLQRETVGAIANPACPLLLLKFVIISVWVEPKFV